MELATILGLATRSSGFLDNQYINRILGLATYIGFSDLNRVDENQSLNPAGTVLFILKRIPSQLHDQEDTTYMGLFPAKTISVAQDYRVDESVFLGAFNAKRMKTLDKNLPKRIAPCGQTWTGR